MDFKKNSRVFFSDKFMEESKTKESQMKFSEAANIQFVKFKVL